MTELKTIKEVVESIVDEDCNYEIDLFHKTFMVECENTIPQKTIDKICDYIVAEVSLKNSKGNVVFFAY